MHHTCYKDKICHLKHTKRQRHKPCPHKYGRNSDTRKSAQACLAVGLVILAVLMIQPAMASVRTESGQATRTGSLLLGEQGNWQEALLQDSSIAIEVQGLLANVTIKQQFKSLSESWLQGTYLFPLPQKAAVRGMTVYIGDRVIHGEVQPRVEAKQTFEQARDAGQVASLVEQQRPNLFTVNLANIAPGDTIDVELDVMLPVLFSDGLFSLVLPTTHTPRYTNATTTDVDDIVGPVAHKHQLRGPRFTLELEFSNIDSIDIVNSSTHNLTKSGTQFSIARSPMDKDVKLSWRHNATSAPETGVYTADHAGHKYVQFLLQPPADSTHISARITRELILVMDTSGSMAGESIRAAKQAMEIALDDLREIDYFNIVTFNHETDLLFSEPRMADASNIQIARNFVRQLQADGGTEMRPALERVLGSKTAERLRQIVFVTDGSVGYEDALLRHIQANIGNNRLFSVGIGTAPNAWFLKKAALVGRGTTVMIDRPDQVKNEIDKLLARLAQPVLTNLDLQWQGGSAELYPNPVPDLYADQPLMLVARVDHNVNGVHISGEQAGNLWTDYLAIPQTAATVSNDHGDDNSADALAIYWSREKIESLMDAQRVAYDQSMHEEEITALAVEVGLISKYTSFVAVESTPVRPLGESLAKTDVANLMPEGNMMNAVYIPVGAAGADTLKYLSLGFAFAACFLAWLARKLRRQDASEHVLLA